VDLISFSEHLLKELRAQIDSRTESLLHGAVSDWGAYQRVVGEVTGLTSTTHLIQDLLKNMETVNDD